MSHNKQTYFIYACRWGIKTKASGGILLVHISLYKNIVGIHEVSQPVVNSFSSAFTNLHKSLQSEVLLVREPAVQLFKYHDWLKASPNKH